MAKQHISGFAVQNQIEQCHQFFSSFKGSTEYFPPVWASKRKQVELLTKIWDDGVMGMVQGSVVFSVTSAV